MDRQQVSAHIKQVFDTTNDDNQMGPILVAVAVAIVIAIIDLAIGRPG